jgi:glycosyltransferase involved in cell wall biosynthesis
MESGPLIAIFCSSFPPEGGGASNRVYNLAVLLRDAGYRVQVVSAMPNYPTGKVFPRYRGKLVCNERIDGISVRRVWLSPSNSASVLARAWSAASFVLSLRLLAFRRVIGRGPALVIVSSPPLPSAAAAVRFFKKRNVPVLLNVSDIWPLSANALGAIGKSALYQRLERMAARMYRRADAITAQSEETLEHIRHVRGDIPPALLYRNLPRAAARTEAVEMPATEGPLRILYPGMLGHAQGLLALCKAIDFGTLGAMLEIYGEGPELAAIRAFTIAHPSRGIFVSSPVSPQELNAKLAVASAALVPLVSPISGALPSKLFTAIHAGVPVLYSGGGEGARIVERYELGWTAAPGDFAGISNNIRALQALPHEAMQAWRLRIRAAAQQHFSKENQDARFLRFIAAVIQGPS